MAPTDPKEGQKPQPIGNFPFVVLFTICTLCVLFILWRRASALRTVVSHQLKTWREPEGRIRLSEDEGPPAREFLEDDYDDDNDGIDDDEPLAERAERLRAAASTEVENVIEFGSKDPAHSLSTPG